jgi:hypothetical protein
MTSQTGSPGLTCPGPGDAVGGLQPNESAMAAMSRGALRANTHVNGFGVVGMALGPNTTPAARTLLATMANGDANGCGTGIGATNPYIWPNGGASGGNSLGAGGSNSTDGPGGGEVTTCAQNTLVAGSALTFASTVAPVVVVVNGGVNTPTYG